MGLTLHTVRKTLDGDTTFKDKFLIWIPCDEYGGIDDINPETDKLFKENRLARRHSGFQQQEASGLLPLERPEVLGGGLQDVVRQTQALHQRQRLT